MDQTDKQEILAAIATMHADIDSRLEDQERHNERIVTDQILMRAELAGVVTRIEALEASRGAHDNRLNGIERKAVDGVNDTRRAVSELEGKLEDTLAAVSQRHDELADGMHETKAAVDGIAGEMDAWKRDAKTAVLNALDEHVTKIEAAADKLTRAPATKNAASVGGAFAGGAAVGAIIEILKHLL